MGPFTTSMFKFPAQEYVGIVLSNNSMPYNGYFPMMASYLFLEDQFIEPLIAVIDTKHAPQLSSSDLEKYTGHYWDEDWSISWKVEVKRDTLRYIRPNGYETSFIPIGKDKFQVLMQSDDRIIVNFNDIGDSWVMDYYIGDAEPIQLGSYIPA